MTTCVCVWSMARVHFQADAACACHGHTTSYNTVLHSVAIQVLEGILSSSICQTSVARHNAFKQLLRWLTYENAV